MQFNIIQWFEVVPSVLLLPFQVYTNTTTSSEKNLSMTASCDRLQPRIGVEFTNYL